MYRPIIFHNGNAYQMISKVKHYQVSPKGVFNKQLLQDWRDHVGADHVLQKNDEYWLCETIKEAEIVEDIAE